MKNLRITLSLLTAVIAAVAVFGMLSSARADAPASKLLSQKQPVKASASESDDYKPENAVDGESNTRWSSAFADAQWIYVDLGTAKTVTEVKINWETATGKEYDIEVSDDATKWTVVKSVKDNTATGWLDYDKLTAKGRYVRLNLKTRATEFGFSMYEFQVFGN